MKSLHRPLRGLNLIFGSLTLLVLMSACTPFQSLEIKDSKVSITSDAEAIEAYMSAFACEEKYLSGGGFRAIGDHNMKCTTGVGPTFEFSKTAEAFEQRICASSWLGDKQRLWGDTWVLNFDGDNNETALSLSSLVFGGTIASLDDYAKVICR